MEVHEILEREVVPDEEEVVIALHLPSWDIALQRGTTSTFANYPQKSCSRTEILSVPQIVDLFKKEIGGGKIKIEGYGVIGVSEIRSLGMSGESQVDFLVTADPTETNPAHAEIVALEPGREKIRKRVPKGLSDKLCNALKVTVLEPY
ncbi:hypothetical protein [Pseudomonas sp. 2023EL-01195]|uniref:hypothetical protein n=1 Tax=Pseudomonas sp. 2023EL-01195 TaxID=3088134 RepID=UPI00296AB2C1|nr:hypothetical protein [Pseudomonas sp. 2023EL-01195]MDW3712456.1 hypothetical protein [Pseudomonas sp. 2023EL-01195]